MSTLRRRLCKLETGRVCPVHRRRLACVTCDQTDELTEAEWAELERLLIVLGVLTPSGEPTAPAGELLIAGVCRRCGHELYCLDCQADPLGGK